MQTSRVLPTSSRILSGDWTEMSTNAANDNGDDSSAASNIHDGESIVFGDVAASEVIVGPTFFAGAFSLPVSLLIKIKDALTHVYMYPHH